MKSTLVAALITLAVTPAFAQSRSVDLTAWYTRADPQGDSIQGRNAFEEFELESEEGFGAAVNIFLGNRISTELAVYVVDLSVVGKTAPVTPNLSFGSVQIIPVTATLQYHFMPEGRFDPYVGAGVAYVFFDDLDELEDLDDVEFDAVELEDDYGFVANAGVGISLTPNIGLNVEVKYVPVEAGARIIYTVGDAQRLDVEVNPVIASAGVTFRF